MAPAARSMPAVRMTSVCPIASMPTTTDCWKISEMFCGSQEGSRRDREDAQAMSKGSERPSYLAPCEPHPHRVVRCG